MEVDVDTELQSRTRLSAETKNCLLQYITNSKNNNNNNAASSDAATTLLPQQITVNAPHTTARYLRHSNPLWVRGVILTYLS